MSSADPQGLQAFPAALDDRESWLEPFDWYREMRENTPVRYDSARGCWDVFRYADVKRVISEDETFSTDPRKASDFVEPEGDGAGLILDTSSMASIRSRSATTSPERFGDACGNQ